MARQLYSAQVAGTKVEIQAASHVSLSHIQALNTTAAVAYLQIFALPAASVTVGTTAPTLSYGIPASAQLTVELPSSLAFTSTGMTLAGTTTRTGSTGAALDVNIAYD